MGKVICQYAKYCSKTCIHKKPHKPIMNTDLMEICNKGFQPCDAGKITICNPIISQKKKVNDNNE